MPNVDNTIHVTHAYRIGETNNKTKPRPIIACLETEKQKYAAVKQATNSNAQQKFKTRLLVKVSVMISKSLDRNSS